MGQSDSFPEVQVPDSFESFYRSEYGAVVALAYGLSGTRWTAEDLAQEAFLRVHRDWERVSEMESPAGWVRRIVINLSNSRFRRLRSETTARLRLASQSSTASAPPQESSEFWREARRLPKQQAAVVALRYIDDLSIAQIADVLGIAEGTVKALLHTARSRLGQILLAKGLIDEV
jgi:RNA polymerase sigma-70 factor (ECF subfamily)